MPDILFERILPLINRMGETIRRIVGKHGMQEALTDDNLRRHYEGLSSDRKQNYALDILTTFFFDSIEPLASKKDNPKPVLLTLDNSSCINKLKQTLANVGIRFERETINPYFVNATDSIANRFETFCALSHPNLTNYNISQSQVRHVLVTNESPEIAQEYLLWQCQLILNSTTEQIKPQLIYIPQNCHEADFQEFLLKILTASPTQPVYLVMPNLRAQQDHQVTHKIMQKLIYSGIPFPYCRVLMSSNQSELAKLFRRHASATSDLTPSSCYTLRTGINEETYLLAMTEMFRLQADNTQLRAALEATQQNMETEIARLHVEFESAAQGLNADIDRLRDQVSSSALIRSQLEKTIAQQEKYIAELEKQIAELERMALEQSLDTSTASMDNTT